MNGEIEESEGQHSANQQGNGGPKGHKKANTILNSNYYLPPDLY
jgi:hypothetical protein